jgi:alpha-glucan,water dikinase
MQKVVSERMTDKARSCPDPWARLYARLALAGLPRGGGNGDDIRMGILHIMREYGIKEGHRPVSDVFVCVCVCGGGGVNGHAKGVARRDTGQ